MSRSARRASCNDALLTEIFHGPCNHSGFRPLAHLRCAAQSGLEGVDQRGGARPVVGPEGRHRPRDRLRSAARRHVSLRVCVPARSRDVRPLRLSRDRRAGAAGVRELVLRSGRRHHACAVPAAQGQVAARSAQRDAADRARRRDHAHAAREPAQRQRGRVRDVRRQYRLDAPGLWRHVRQAGRLSGRGDFGDRWPKRPAIAIGSAGGGSRRKNFAAAVDRSPVRSSSH